MKKQKSQKNNIKLEKPNKKLFSGSYSAITLPNQKEASYSHKTRTAVFFLASLIFLSNLAGFSFFLNKNNGFRLNFDFSNLLGLFIKTPAYSEEYNPEKEAEEVKNLILAFYQGYQELNPEKLSQITEEPLSVWEKHHSENLKNQEKNYKQPKISLSDLNFEFLNFKADEGEVVVKRKNLQVIMPFKFGETSQGEMRFKVKKINGWKIVDRTYNSLWVSTVY